jgi:hypothetical protein
MDTVIDPALVKAWQDGFAPPERLGIKDFAAKYISLPNSYAIPGRVDIKRSRYMLAVLEALEDPNVRIVVLQCAVQTGKSLIAELFAPYLIVNAPGNILWLCQDETMAKTIAETRINPILYSTEPVKNLLPRNRFAKKRNLIHFPNHTALIIDGANPNNLQSLSVRYLIGDEVWRWKAGYLQQFLARSAAFPNTSKALIISQAGDLEHDFTQLWDLGHSAEWAWTCPHCNRLQQYSFNQQRADSTYAGVRWDRNERTKPDGQTYNLVEVAKTARLECFHCAKEVTDTPVNRRLLNDTGDYIITNPNADPKIKSFRWNALANIDIAIGSVVSQYLQAKQADEIAGYRTPLEHFQNKVLALPWNPNLQLQVIRAAIAAYDVSEKWGDERHRFLTIDVQADCFWFVVRAWALNGESRLIAFGRKDTWEQLKEVQDLYKVANGKVFVDARHKPNECYAKCVQFGAEKEVTLASGRKVKHFFAWQALMGSDAKDFPHTINGRTERRIYSELLEMDPGIGKPGPKLHKCNRYMFSNESAKDILHRHFRGRAAKFLMFAEDAEYNEQMNSEVKRKFVDKKTGKITWRWVRIKKKNHIWDMEANQMVCASMVGCLGDMPVAPADNEPSEDPKPDAPEGETL